MWRIMHRKLPLLRFTWYRQGTGNASGACILCSTGEIETEEHLFSKCPAAAAGWQVVNNAMHGVGLQHTERTCSRLLGVIDAADLLPRWPNTPRPPPTAQLSRWSAAAWAEIRGTVLYAVWAARCRAIHGTAADRQNATAGIRSAVKAGLRMLIYRHLPEKCKWPLPLNKKCGVVRTTFLHILWGTMANNIAT